MSASPARYVGASTESGSWVRIGVAQLAEGLPQRLELWSAQPLSLVVFAVSIIQVGESRRPADRPLRPQPAETPPRRPDCCGRSHDSDGAAQLLRPKGVGTGTADCVDCGCGITVPFTTSPNGSLCEHEPTTTAGRPQFQPAAEAFGKLRYTDADTTISLSVGGADNTCRARRPSRAPPR